MTSVFVLLLFGILLHTSLGLGRDVLDQGVTNRPAGLQWSDLSMRLIMTSEAESPKWIREGDKLKLRQSGIKFMDITDTIDLGTKAASRAKGVRKISKAKFPKHASAAAQVNQTIGNLSTTFMETALTELTSFHSRYYKSSSGAESSQWLFKLVKELAKPNKKVLVSQFEHPWGQHSIIARVPGSSGNHTIVVGAHQDSANMFLPMLLKAPGADDDGSGTVTILDVFRAIISTKYEPVNDVEFHWYSAEEGGLLGSQAIFSEYERLGVQVAAMLQQDMTGYVKKTLEAGLPESLGVITDYVDPDLTTFIKMIIKSYCSIPHVDTQCGYACSDHASASRAGYASAFVIESEFKLSNPAIHTEGDVISNLSFDHMLEHGKLTAGYAIELGNYKF